MHFADDRARFLVSHAGLRRCLAGALGCASEVLSFRPGPFGKPALATVGRELHFNLTHSRSLALVAWSASAPLGVDVEDVQRQTEEIGIGRLVFSAREQQALERLPAGDDRRAAFFELWTRKEAVLKALGTGLTRSATEIDIGSTFGGGPWVWSDPTTGLRWTIADIDVGPDQKAAVAVQGEAIVVRPTW